MVDVTSSSGDNSPLSSRSPRLVAIVSGGVMARPGPPNTVAPPWVGDIECAAKTREESAGDMATGGVGRDGAPANIDGPGCSTGRLEGHCCRCELDCRLEGADRVIVSPSFSGGLFCPAAAMGLCVVLPGPLLRKVSRRSSRRWIEGDALALT